MQYEINTKKMLDIMKSFYTLSGIRMALINTEFHEILAYPEKFTDLCSLLRECPESCVQCQACDANAYKSCLNENGPIIYQCHAGLTEAACILRHDSMVVGYVMFGQVTNISNKTEFRNKVIENCSNYPISQTNIEKALKKIIHKTDIELYAAMNIFEICISYIIQNQLVYGKNDLIASKLCKYVNENISKKINVNDIASELHISRTQLYAIMNKKYNMGVSEFIMSRRIMKAKALKDEGKMTTNEIAEATGFTDVNYFRRVFRKKKFDKNKTY